MRFLDWANEKFDEFLEYGARYKSAVASKYFAMILIIPLIIIFFLIVFIISNSNSSINWIRDKMNPNELNIQLNGFSKSDNVVIKWTNDNYSDTIVLYANGLIVYDKFKTSGDNIFTIYVNDSLIFRKIQYKNIYWKGYKYSFRIKKQNNKYNTALIIE